MIRVRRAFPAVVGNRVPTYTERLAAMFDSNLVLHLPLDETTGTAAVNRGALGVAANGTYAGVTLANADAPGGGKAPYFDGTNDYVDAYSAALAGVTIGPLGTFFLWAKTEDAAAWADGYRHAAYLYVNDNNRIFVRHTPTPKNLSQSYIAGGTSNESGHTPPTGSLAWNLYAITWNKAQNRVRVYINGMQIGATLTGLGVWAGSFGVNTTLLGAFNKTPLYAWKGWLAHAGLLTSEATGSQIRQIANIAIPRQIVCVAGDSISAAASGWADLLCQYNSGNSYFVSNHAVSGASIITDIDGDADMDLQIAAMAEENANIIILALGTNDNDAGDMNALQAEVEENIAEVKLSNPSATVYYMNVLPRTATKTNIRAAIAAACTAQGITCWDTTGWIDPATDTSDGLHPNAGGHAKILTQVLARI